MQISLSYNVYTASTNISTKFSRLYVIIRSCLLFPATSKPCPAAGTFEIAANHWHRRNSNRRMEMSDQGMSWNCFIGTHSKITNRFRNKIVHVPAWKHAPKKTCLKRISQDCQICDTDATAKKLNCRPST